MSVFSWIAVDGGRDEYHVLIRHIVIPDNRILPKIVRHGFRNPNDTGVLLLYIELSINLRVILQRLMKLSEYTIVPRLYIFPFLRRCLGKCQPGTNNQVCVPWCGPLQERPFHILFIKTCQAPKRLLEAIEHLHPFFTANRKFLPIVNPRPFAKGSLGSLCSGRI